MNAAIIILISIYLLTISVISVRPIIAYITESSSKYGILDIENKCDRSVPNNYTSSSNNMNASLNASSCYGLGIKGGFIDGNQSRGQFGYSLVDGCSPQYSLNYCYGYLIGYSRGYGHHISNTEIWNTANHSGYEAGYLRGAKPSEQISCTVSIIFCGGYLHGYSLGYTYGMHYWTGYAEGEKQAYNDIKDCREQNNPNIPGNHTQEYRSGWLDGYSDATDQSTSVTNMTLCNIR